MVDEADLLRAVRLLESLADDPAQLASVPRSSGARC
jgi:hypothetical protein